MSFEGDTAARFTRYLECYSQAKRQSIVTTSKGAGGQGGLMVARRWVSRDIKGKRC